MKQFILLITVLAVLFLGSAITSYGWGAEFKPVPAATNWHPGFIEVSVEQVNPGASWVPPTRIDKGALQTILVNTEHIISIAIGRGHTSKTPRQSILLTNGIELLVYGDYDDILKLIRASWVGTGKK